MAKQFAVQGRVVEWRSGRIVRDESRSAETDTHDEALRAAHEMGELGFTVWIFTMQRGTGTSPVFTLVDGPRASSQPRAGGRPPNRSVRGPAGRPT